MSGERMRPCSRCSGSGVEPDPCCGHVSVLGESCPDGCCLHDSDVRDDDQHGSGDGQ